VLVPGRHVEGLHHLDHDEAEGLGRLLRRASAAVVEVTGCQRTYVMLFGKLESFNHLHVHIVPRYEDLPVEHRRLAVFAYLAVTWACRRRSSYPRRIATSWRLSSVWAWRQG